MKRKSIRNLKSRVWYVGAFAEWVDSSRTEGILKLKENPVVQGLITRQGKAGEESQNDFCASFKYDPDNQILSCKVSPKLCYLRRHH